MTGLEPTATRLQVAHLTTITTFEEKCRVMTKFIHLFVASCHLVPIHRSTRVRAHWTFTPQVPKVPDPTVLTPHHVIVLVCLSSKFERVLASEEERRLVPGV